MEVYRPRFGEDLHGADKGIVSDLYSDGNTKQRCPSYEVFAHGGDSRGHHRDHLLIRRFEDEPEMDQLKELLEELKRAD